MLQRIPVTPDLIADTHAEFSEALSDLVSTYLDALPDGRADQWDAVQRHASRAHDLMDRLLGAMCVAGGEPDDFAGCLDDIGEIGRRKAESIREHWPVYDPTRELRLSASQLGVGRYARGW